MATVCSSSDIISFPRQTNIQNIKADFYDKMPINNVNIEFKFTPRTTIPQFADPSRQTGELNEAPNSTSCKYENKDYELYNVQLCGATHKKFLDDNNADNRIDIVITYLRKYDQANIEPRFVILVLPLINDPSLQVSDLYLSGLGGEIPNTILSLGNLFISTNIFYYYTTCLEPKGDNAFVYVNKKGTPISQSLYYKILSQWKLQPLSTLMSDISNDVNNIKQKAQNLLGSITKSNDLTDIQSKLDSASALTQTINFSTIVETWSSYSAYPGIVLNVPSKNFTLDSIKKESFQNNINKSGIGMSYNEHKPLPVLPKNFTFDTLLKEGFYDATGSSGSSSGSNTSNNISNINSNTRMSLGNVKCVPLDLDGVIDKSGNINFDAKGNITLSEVQKQRDKIRTEVPFIDFAKKNKNFEIAVGVIGGFLAFCLLILAGFTAYKWKYPTTNPTPPSSQIFAGSSSIWYYLIIGAILGFAGYLIGVATTPSI